MLRSAFVVIPRLRLVPRTWSQERYAVECQSLKAETSVTPEFSNDGEISPPVKGMFACLSSPCRIAPLSLAMLGDHNDSNISDTWGSGLTETGKFLPYARVFVQYGHSVTRIVGEVRCLLSASEVQPTFNSDVRGIS